MSPRTVTFALVLACLAACSPAAGGAGLSVSGNGASIAIDESWKPCQSDSDCVRVGTSCDGCCGEDAVAATREAEYRESAAELCEGYEGGQCDCVPLPTDVACVNELCALVPIEE